MPASFNFYYWEGMLHQGEYQSVSVASSFQFHLCCLILFTSDYYYTLFTLKYGGKMHIGTLVKSKIITDSLKPPFICFPKGTWREH